MAAPIVEATSFSSFGDVYGQLKIVGLRFAYANFAVVKFELYNITV